MNEKEKQAVIKAHWAINTWFQQSAPVTRHHSTKDYLPRYDEYPIDISAAEERVKDVPLHGITPPKHAPKIK